MTRLIGKNTRGTRYEVTFPTLASTLKVAPSKITIIQRAYAHQIALLEFPSYSATRMNLFATNVPVQIDWYQDNKRQTWLGYVTSVQRQSAAQTTEKMIVRCVSPSWELKNSTQQVFKNKTIPEVAEKIASQFGFSFITDRSKTAVRLPSIVIPGNSYWEWLVEHAQAIGYGLTVVGTRMYFMPYRSFIDNGSTNVPILQMWSQDIPAGVSFLDRTLIEFKSEKGEYHEGNISHRAQKIIQGIDPISNRVIKEMADPKRKTGSLRKATNDTIFNDNLAEQVVNNKALAIARAEGAALLAQFSTPATARAQGDLDFRPFQPVYVEGTGAETDGYWLIMDVTHTLHINGEYTAMLSLLTDGNGRSVQTRARQTTAALSGQVNLEEAIKYKKNRVTSSPAKSSVLKTKGNMFTQGNQGGNRTNTKWKATAKSKAEGRR